MAFVYVACSKHAIKLKFKEDYLIVLINVKKGIYKIEWVEGNIEAWMRGGYIVRGGRDMAQLSYIVRVWPT